MYHKEVEYRSYGLYSDVAKQSGYTTAQIDTVYSWYLNKTFADLVEIPHFADKQDNNQTSDLGYGWLRALPHHNQRLL